MGRGLDGYFDIRALALCSFEGPREAGSLPVSGGYGEGETPLPFPNRAVKPLSADGTWPARAWESRTPPVFLEAHGPPKGGPASFSLAYAAREARRLLWGWVDAMQTVRRRGLRLALVPRRMWLR